MVHVFWDEIGQVGVLGVVPNHLDRIEFGGLSRQPDYLKLIRVLILQPPDGLAMSTISIQHQDELAPQMPMDHRDEGYDLLVVDVLAANLEVEAQSLPHGRDRDPRDHRETIVAIPVVLDRRLSLRGPGAAHNRLEHEAAFVDQHDAPAVFLGFFFARGHSSFRHRAMASSSLSRARRSGFWQLQPMPRRMCHT